MRRPGEQAGIPMRKHRLLGELSSTTALLHGMPFRGGVIQEARKAKSTGDARYIVLYGGKVHRSSRQDLALIARDRGFDLSHQRFLHSRPDEKRAQITRSIQFQRRAKRRGVALLRAKLAGTKNQRSRQLIQRDLLALRGAKAHSPHLGHTPISAYLTKYSTRRPK